MTRTTGTWLYPVGYVTFRRLISRVRLSLKPKVRSQKQTILRCNYSAPNHLLGPRTVQSLTLPVTSCPLPISYTVSEFP